MSVLTLRHKEEIVAVLISNGRKAEIVSSITPFRRGLQDRLTQGIGFPDAVPLSKHNFEPNKSGEELLQRIAALYTEMYHFGAEFSEIPNPVSRAVDLSVRLKNLDFGDLSWRQWSQVSSDLEEGFAAASTSVWTYEASGHTNLNQRKLAVRFRPSFAPARSIQLAFFVGDSESLEGAPADFVQRTLEVMMSEPENPTRTRALIPLYESLAHLRKFANEVELSSERASGRHLNLNERIQSQLLEVVNALKRPIPNYQAEGKVHKTTRASRLVGIRFEGRVINCYYPEALDVDYLRAAGVLGTEGKVHVRGLLTPRRVVDHLAVEGSEILRVK